MDFNKKRYHLMVDGLRITSETMTLDEITNAFGDIKKLESKGIRVVEYNEKPTILH